MSDQMFEGLPPEESTPPYRRVTPESLLQDELRKARARIEVLEAEVARQRKRNAGSDWIWGLKDPSGEFVAVSFESGADLVSRTVDPDGELLEFQRDDEWRKKQAKGFEVAQVRLVEVHVVQDSPHSQGASS